MQQLVLQITPKFFEQLTEEAERKNMTLNLYVDMLLHIGLLTNNVFRDYFKEQP